MMKPLGKPSRGIGLVEIMVGVAVLGVLLAVAIPSMQDMFERRRVVAIGLEVASIFNFAKSEANVNGDVVTVHLEKDPSGTLSCASVNAQHAADSCKCYLPEATMCGKATVRTLRLFQVKNSEGVSFDASASTWGGIGERVNFAHNLRSLEVTDLKVNVTGRRTGAKLRVELNSANRIRTCTPDGSISGFPTC